MNTASQQFTTLQKTFFPATDSWGAQLEDRTLHGFKKRKPWPVPFPAILCRVAGEETGDHTTLHLPGQRRRPVTPNTHYNALTAFGRGLLWNCACSLPRDLVLLSLRSPHRRRPTGSRRTSHKSRGLSCYWDLQESFRLFKKKKKKVWSCSEATFCSFHET